MNKRDFLDTVIAGAAAGVGAISLPAHAQNGPKNSAGPIILTVSGQIGAGNRGALDTALDQMMVKQKISFSKAQTFDFAALTALRSVTIRPSLEYDRKQHDLRGPLLTDVMKASGAITTDRTMLLLRAVDGYAVQTSIAEVTKRRFILATHLDGGPMTLGGVGPLWAIYDADSFPDMVAKPISDRFSMCPWATYHIEVKEA